MKDHIDTILETATPRQTVAQHEQLFSRVMREVREPGTSTRAVPSPYYFWRVHMMNTRTLVAAVLIVVLGTGGTVVAAESAKPGDALFPIEKATENLRLTLASAERRGELETRFLEKRFTEVSELLTEESFVAPGTEKRLISEAGESRIASAVAVLVDHIERVDDPRQAERLRNLLREVETIHVEGRDIEQADERRIRIDDTRFKVRTETERIRIDAAGGDMRIRYDDDDRDEDKYEYQVDRSGYSADSSDDVSRQRDDNERDVNDNEQRGVSERADDEPLPSSSDSETDREENDRDRDTDREDTDPEDTEFEDSHDNGADDDRDRDEDDRKGPSGDDRDW